MAVFRASPSLVRALRPAPPRTLAVPRLHQQIFRQTAAVTRFSTLGARYDKKDPSKSSSIDLEEERRIAQQKIESDPSKVSLESSTRQVFENYKQPGQDAVDVNDGIKHDLVCPHSLSLL